MTKPAPTIIHLLGAPVYAVDIAIWGGLATILLTLIMSGCRWRGLSRMSIPFMLGTMFTADRRKASAIGLVVHAVNGWSMAVVYAVALQRVATATWWSGAALGLVHALFVLLVLMPLIADLHPRMASERHGPTAHRVLEPPGFFALNYGIRTPMVTVLAHLVYGAILGAAFQVVPV